MSGPEGPPEPPAADWPARFRAAHGRAPRVLHVCNIANYAWVNAGLMRSRGVDAVVLDPDFYHFASAPEWLEAEIEGDIGDHFHPRWRRIQVRGFQRPEWYLNGPGIFVYAEFEARESADRLRRAIYGAFSRLYRHAISGEAGHASLFRRLLEGADPVSLTLKRAVRFGLRVAGRLHRAAARSAGHAPAAAGPPAPPPSIAAVPEAMRNSLRPRGVPADALKAAFGRFDAIIGYALGGSVPMSLGLRRVIALELGTLRGLPFEDSPTGQLCAWLYREAEEVFVTNLDCLEPARRLGIPESRITPVLHPFDVERADAFGRAPTPSPLAHLGPYFVCPARHHWKIGNASWLKGNDVLIRGAAEAMRRGADFRLVMVEWGEELALSRALIAEEGLAERVHWIPPAPRPKLWALMAGAAGVLDQFAASAFGGVGLEAMALGRPVISRIEGAELGPFFTTPPPIRHAATPAEVAEAIVEVLSVPGAAERLGEAGRAWMATEHGVERQLALQFAACERLVARHGPAN